MYLYCANNPVNNYDPTGLGVFPVREAPSWAKPSPLLANDKPTINPQSPPPPQTGYVPPKSKSPVTRQPAPGALGGQTGWPDKKGDIWVPDRSMDGGPGWRVHSPNGDHRHVYPSGKERVHSYSDPVCWDINGYNLYETTINGQRVVTDVPPIIGNQAYNNNYSFIPIQGIPTPNISFNFNWGWNFSFVGI